MAAKKKKTVTRHRLTPDEGEKYLTKLQKAKGMKPAEFNAYIRHVAAGRLAALERNNK